MSPKNLKRVTLAVSGSVAIYKACEIASTLTQKKVQVRVALTRNAAKLISPQLFSAITGNPAIVDEFGDSSQPSMPHIDFSDCDLFLAAPASADLIGRLAHGLADDFVTTTALALAPGTPKLIAPAMNVKMYRNNLFQKNLQTLQENGYELIAPDAGFLACGMEGVGRLADPKSIVEKVLKTLR